MLYVEVSTPSPPKREWRTLAPRNVVGPRKNALYSQCEIRDEGAGTRQIFFQDAEAWRIGLMTPPEKFLP